MKTNYVKRTQKDYPMSFKLEVVREIEQGELTRSQALSKYGIQAKSTIRDWLKKYGTFDWENQSYKPMPKSPQQRIIELEEKIKLLEKQKELEKKVNEIQKKNEQNNNQKSEYKQFSEEMLQKQEQLQ